MGDWGIFFAAQVGASAALAGLIFVSVSLNLTQIIASAQLPMRAFQALVVLLEILTIASLAIVPQPRLALGIEVLVIGGGVWALVFHFDRRTFTTAASRYRKRAFSRVALSQIAALLYVAAGIALLMSGNGVYWLVPAILCSYLIALLDAWVLLVEINR
jgi:modulator of FtsH protease